MSESLYKKGENPWRDAIEDALVIYFIEPKSKDPALILNQILCYEGNIALDPAVSKEARELYLKGWEDGMRRALNIAASMPGIACRSVEERISYELKNNKPKIEEEVDMEFS